MWHCAWTCGIQRCSGHLSCVMRSLRGSRCVFAGRWTMPACRQGSHCMSLGTARAHAHEPRGLLRAAGQRQLQGSHPGMRHAAPQPAGTGSAADPVAECRLTSSSLLWASGTAATSQCAPAPTWWTPMKCRSWSTGRCWLPSRLRCTPSGLGGCWQPCTKPSPGRCGCLAPSCMRLRKSRSCKMAPAGSTAGCTAGSDTRLLPMQSRLGCA